eukprot:TRINITY_DN3855_c0_g1_i2.p1 TRINITY_DN3855_c0_g1~~TRINITY_DN3855_c0_g1_i2.p1  ORF type:complete len:248 (+),score=81.94 TRINITY_DN3855_c0_g1_i2:67-744(+)
MAQEVRFKIQYFPLRGRGEAIRLALEDSEASYTFFPPGNWLEVKAAGIENGQVPFGQLPVLEDTKYNVFLGQSNAILRHVGRECNLYGNSPADAAIVDMWLDSAEDLRVAYLRLIYTNQLAYDAFLAFLSGPLNSTLSLMEKNLARTNEGPYILGQQVSVADFSLFELFDVLARIAPAFLDSTPRLKVLYDAVASRPRVAAYVASGRRPERINGNGLGQEPPSRS